MPLIREDESYLVGGFNLKNISQIGNLPQIGVKIKNMGTHHLVMISCQ